MNMSAFAVTLSRLTYLFAPGLFLVCVALVYQEMIREDVERDPTEIHFEETCSLVRSVAGEAFVAPIISNRQVNFTIFYGKSGAREILTRSLAYS